MTGDYTKVPLRPDERWTGARMQQGRVLLDHDWNLNLDAEARLDADLITDVIGPAGVAQGSEAFGVLGVPAGDLQLGAGHMWVGGLEAMAPAPFTYTSQEAITELPGEGRAFVYLDAFSEHVQSAEDPSLVDPALAPVDATNRTRVGWRVRAVTTGADSCSAAMAAVAPVGVSDATLTITRAAPAAPPDPCDPPGDPLGVVPDGLLRIEVLDAGTPDTARFAWSFEDGAAAVTVASFAGDQVTLAPSASVKYGVGDLVEVSWLVRRADRVDHGPLYTVADVAAGPGGDVVTLDRAIPAALTFASGLCLRRWDGEVVGAATDQAAPCRGVDLGARFRAAGTALLPGDWWGARLRESAADPVELRADAPPDGILHAFAPLALVDLNSRTVEHDCRPSFPPLTGLESGGGSCTVVAHPGDDLQAKVDALPDSGGELCLAAGLYPLVRPLLLAGRRRVVVSGVGPATVLRGAGIECALRIERCTDVEVRNLRVEGGRPQPPGDRHVDGAITAVGCVDVRVVGCELFCPDAVARSQACLAVRSSDDGTVPPDRVRIEDNRFEVGAWQTGVLVVDSDSTRIEGNHLRVADPPPNIRLVPRNPLFVHTLARLFADGIISTQAVAEGPAVTKTVAVTKAAKVAKAAKAAKAGKATKAATKAARSTKAAAKATKATKATKTGKAVGADKVASVITAAVPAGALTITIAETTALSPLSSHFVSFATPARLAKEKTPARLVASFARSLAGVRIDSLAVDLRALLSRLTRQLRPALQGIVVGGNRAGTVQILDNLVEGTIQGIHVGVSDRPREAPLLAGDVVVARNIVHAMVPAAYDRDRHAIFVGNARSVHVLDTTATLTRPDADIVRLRTPVEAVRIHGVLGPFLAVRQTSAAGFAIGVRVVPLPPFPSPKLRMWLVAETVAPDGLKGAMLPGANDPAAPVDGERNVP